MFCIQNKGKKRKIISAITNYINHLIKIRRSKNKTSCDYFIKIEEIEFFLVCQFSKLNFFSFENNKVLLTDQHSYTFKICVHILCPPKSFCLIFLFWEANTSQSFFWWVKFCNLMETVGVFLSHVFTFKDVLLQLLKRSFFYFLWDCSSFCSKEPTR